MEKVYFKAGDLVKIKQLENPPTMVIKLINKAHIRSQDSENINMFLGVTCFWFTKNNEYQEKMFSTKDLQHIK